MTSREERIAKNEAIFREVNERVRALVSPENGRVDFLCECGREDCFEQVRLTFPEYERVRADPVHFFIKRGHEIPDVEAVIEEHEDFLIIRKNPEEQEIAKRSDPRA